MAEAASANRKSRARRPRRTAVGPRADRRAELRRDAFVGVEDEHPVVSRTGIVEGPVSLRTEAVEVALVEPNAGLPADLLGTVGAERIDDDHVVVSAGVQLADHIAADEAGAAGNYDHG